MMTDQMVDDAVDALVDDGDEWESGEWTLRLSIVPDDHMSVMDEETFGALAWVQDYRGDADWGRWPTAWIYSGHHQPRPDGFDGNAEIIRTAQSDPVWWQPPTDGPKRGTEEFRQMRALVMDLLDYGYIGMTVEAFRHRDIYGRGCVEAVAGLFGIEAMYDDDYRRDVVRELVGEIEGQMGAYFDDDERIGPSDG